MHAIAVFDPRTSRYGIGGTVRFYQPSPREYTTITFDLSGFARPGKHGCHIHMYGDLSEGCASSCAHYNPRGTKHSALSTRHVGDLANNIVASISGQCLFSYTDDLVNLSGPESVIGRSVVIHQGVDDCGIYQNQRDPSGQLTQLAIDSGENGNAGIRTACAVIGIARQKKKC